MKCPVDDVIMYVEKAKSSDLRSGWKLDYMAIQPEFACVPLADHTADFLLKS